MQIFLAALGLVFITLKLTGHITWSWWLVLLPLYGPVVFGLLCLTGAGLIWLSMTKEQRAKHRAKKSLNELANELANRRF